MPKHSEAIDLLRAEVKALGLTITIDHSGTLIGGHQGPPGSNTLMIGSHRASGREASAYDIVMGIALPLMALAKLGSERTNLSISFKSLGSAD